MIAQEKRPHAGPPRQMQTRQSIAGPPSRSRERPSLNLHGQRARSGRYPREYPHAGPPRQMQTRQAIAGPPSQSPQAFAGPPTHWPRGTTRTRAVMRPSGAFLRGHAGFDDRGEQRFRREDVAANVDEVARCHLGEERVKRSLQHSLRGSRAVAWARGQHCEQVGAVLRGRASGQAPRAGCGHWARHAAACFAPCPCPWR